MNVNMVFLLEQNRPGFDLSAQIKLRIYSGRIFSLQIFWRWNTYEARYLRRKSKNKKWNKTIVFFHNLYSLEVIFIITIVTRLNEYAEIINLFTGILSES